MTMMDEASDDFSCALQSLMVKNRDPRAIRLAAVTSAMMDVCSKEANPAKFYASIVNTLQEETLDLATQLALLELLSVTIPHVSSSTLTATLAVTSRTLRGIVSSCRLSEVEETKDELGGLNATLRACCRVTSLFLQHISPTADAMEVRKFLQGSLVLLWEDHRPKVRKAAQQAVSEVLPSGNKEIQTTMTDYCVAQLGRKKNSSAVIHTLQWLPNNIFFLQTERMSTKVMELLMSILQLQDDDSHHFVAKFQGSAAIQERVMLANGILSLLISMLEDHEYHNQEWSNQFATRVVASLLQGKPTMAFGAEALAENAKTHYGQALMVASQRCDPAVGLKLLPLAVQFVVQMSKPDATNESVAVAEGVLPEVTKLIRTQLMNSEGSILQECFSNLVLSLEVVLQPIYKPTWSVSLVPLALMLQVKPDDDACPAIVGLLLRRHEEETSSSYKHAIEEAVSTIIQGTGLEQFWQWISWKDETKKGRKNQAISPHRAWLLPVLKCSAIAASTTPPRLKFFQTTILGLARQCDSEQTNFGKARVIDLWSLLNCFCVQAPPDFAEVFPDFAQTLVRAMGDERYPQLVTILCGSLKILAQATQHSGDEEVLSKVSTKLLPALFKLVETMQGSAATSHNKKDDEDMDGDDDKKAAAGDRGPEAQRVQSVTAAIAELAHVAPPSYVQSLLKKVIQRLLTATQSEEDETEKIVTLLGLSQSLVSSESLDNDAIALIYRAVKPFVRSDEHPPRVQKRAYKALLEICQKHQQFVTEPERLSELSELLIGSLMTCQVSARHLRLKCMTMVVAGFSSSNKEQMEIIPKAMGEVLLCLKDSNGKAREAAYQLLLATAKVMDDMTAYFKIIAGALAAQTPHMRSAAVMAMSRLVFEYARTDSTVQALLPMMLQTVVVLFDENSREVIKSVVGFVRVSVAAMSPEQLEPLLPGVVEGLLKYHKGKERFRDKIKIIIKKLVRVYGYDRLMPLVPESDTRLLTHMRKLDERAKRRKAAQRADGNTEEHNDFDEMMESDEEDSDDGRTLMTGATGLTKFTEMTGRTGKSMHTIALEKLQKESNRSKSGSTVASGRSKIDGPRLKSDKDGEVLDMLDPSMSKSVRFAIEEGDEDGDSDDGMMEFDELGRLLVRDDLEEESERRQATIHDDDEDDQIESRGVKKRKLSKFESAKIARDEAKKKKMTKNLEVRALGAAYKSKKAGGDVQKRGQKFEPYAFVPLDGKSYTKKNRRKAVESMSTVVRGSSKRKR
jgi:ribosomal RNA-processing protein 12